MNTTFTTQTSSLWGKLSGALLKSIFISLILVLGTTNAWGAYYLYKTGTGNTPGRGDKIASFTGNNPYYATWISNTSSASKFYVSNTTSAGGTNTDYLNSETEFGMNEEKRQYLYGSTGTQYAHSRQMTPTKDAVYRFCFREDNGVYYFKYQPYIIVGNGDGNWLGGHFWKNDETTNIATTSKTYEDCPAGIKIFRIIPYGEFDTNHGKTQLTSSNVPCITNEDNNIVFVTNTICDITIGFDGANITLTVTPNDGSSAIKPYLDGSYAMFYFGDSWGSGKKWLNKTDANDYYNATSISNVNSVVVAAGIAQSGQKYKVSNNGSWPGNQMSQNVSQGALYNSANINDVKFGSIPTFTKNSASISLGTQSSGLVANCDKSVVENTQTITYYYTQDDGNTWTQFNPNDVSSLAAGTYTVRALAHDGNIYVRTEQEATLTIEEDNKNEVEILAGDNGTVEPSGVQEVGKSGITVTATANSGYTFDEWIVDGGAEVSNVSEQRTTVTASSTGKVTATFRANTYSVKFNANGGSGTMTNQSFSYDETEKALTTNTFIRENHIFVGWATSANGSVVYTDNQLVKNISEEDGDIINLYAVWATISITAHPEHIRTSDRLTLSISYTNIPQNWRYVVKIGTGIYNNSGVGQYTPITDGTGSSTYTAVTQIPVATNTVVVGLYANGDNLAQEPRLSTSVTVICENTHEVGVFAYTEGVNSTTGGTVNKNSIQPSTNVPEEVVATPKTGYMFDQWYVINDNANITIENPHSPTTNVTATDGGQIYANFVEDLSSTWYIAGTTDNNSPFTGWAEGGKQMYKKKGYSDKQIYYCTFEVSTIATQDHHFEFQPYDSSTKRYYGYNNYWVTKENNSTSVYLNNSQNMKFRPYVAGTYEFKLDCTGTDPVLTVTWPVVNQIRFYSAQTGGSEVQVHDWDNTNANTWTKTITLNKGTHYFKVLEDSEFLGNTGTMTRNGTSVQSGGWSMSNVTENCGITADVAGDYVFKYDKTTNKLTVTYPEAYTVTYSRTPTAAADAPTTDPSITSGNYVAAGTNVTFTAKAAKTGYTFKGWYDNNTGAGAALSTNQTYTCIINANTNVYAVYTENTTNVTIDANDRSFGTLKVGGADENWGYSTSVGVATTKSITATPKDNSYEFTGWTLIDNVTTSDDPKNTTITIKGNGSGGLGTVTANFQKIVRTITFDQEGGEGGTETLNATYGEATTQITTPTKTGYTFRGYWTGDNGTDTKIVDADGTWIASQANFTDANNKWIVTSDKTLYAKWEENLSTITIKTSPEGAGALKVGGNNFTAGNTTTVGITTSRTVVASNTDGFTFKEWQKTDNITITEGSLTSPSITIKGNGNGGAGTLTAVYDEDLSTPYVFIGGTAFGGDNWATEYPLTKRPGESNVNIGYVTFNITGINSNGGNEAYQFKIKKGDTWYGIPADGNWWYMRDHSTEAMSLKSNTVNIGLITDMVGVYTIKVDYTNESDPKLTVSYPSTEFYLLGFGNDNSYWAEDESKKFSVDAGKATITKTLTAGTHEFKIEEKVNDDEIWRTSSTTITRANNTNIDFSNTSNDADNAKITADVAGIYTFTYDVVNQKLTVIYPSKLTLTDGPTTSVSSATTSNPLTTVPGQTITATPTITSTGAKALCWGLYTDAECTDGNKVDNITFTSLGAGKVSFALPEVEKTYYLKLTIHPDADCKQDPEETIIATINATTENFIFFKKNISASKWNNVYVNFYNRRYWDSEGKGSGNVNNDDIMKSANNKMTQIKGTNIFYFNYSGITPGNVVSFVNQSGNYNNFHMCQVVYREDMDLGCAPMFVSRDYIQSHNYINSSEYYDGYWTTFAPDVDAKHYICIGNTSYRLESATPTRTYTLTLDLSENTTVHFYLKKACHTADGYGFYGVYGEMDVKNCTNWVMYHGNNNIALKTRSAGDYTFIVSFLDNGEIRVSVEYPLMEGDYQLIYKDSDNRPHPSDYVRNRANGEDIVSLYINKEKSPTVTLQQWDGNKWSVKKGANNQPITVDLSPITADGTMTSGVYNFKITQPAEGDITSNEAIEVQGRYLGYYYIRTNSAEGKWKTYKMDSHKMTYSAYADENEDFTHYFCKFLSDNKPGSEDFIGTHDDDISFAIACDYAKALTDTLEGDTYTNGLNLYESASVRFMYNTHTNGLRRAYLKGRHESTEYLKLTKGEGNMTLNEGGEPINEITFEDEGNWIYSIDVYVTPVQINDAFTFSGTLTAKYPINTDIGSNIQYFYATPGQDTNSDGIPDSYSHKQIIGGSDGAQLKVAIRYDFKTNRLMRAWKPTDEITDDLPISADILLIRKGQDAATQINLSSETEITDVQTIYGAIQFDYNDVVGKVTSWNSHAYEFGRYYVSFPFDVAVSDIFGFGTLNENWQIQRYNGQKRADIGWFAETSTFWEPLQETEVMKANEGYILALDRKTLNGDNNVMWQNKEAGSSVYLYFPSSSATKTIANGTQTIHVPKHQCYIDREFQVENGTKTVNHQNTDSHWNVIGSPLFENKVATHIVEGPETEHPDDVYPAKTKLRYFYKWQYEEGKENTYAVSAAFNTEHSFLTMHGYMVQYAGDVTFEGASITPPASVAARRVAENKQNYTVELQLYNEDIEASRTYVELRENAIDSFLLSEDLYMIRSSHFADVFTYAGTYDVAANVLSVNSHIVLVGVQVKKAGTYTFSMTTPFDGTVTLIDYHTGSRTNLGWSDYTVTLEKGTINDRFALEINIQNVSTDVEGNTGHFKGKDAVKFLHNGILYIKKGDAIYDARGSRVSMSYEL